MLPGGATVPGRALIDVLPLVAQMVLKSVLWHVGRATAEGAATPAATVNPATISTVLLRSVMKLPLFRVLAGMFLRSGSGAYGQAETTTGAPGVIGVFLAAARA